MTRILSPFILLFFAVAGWTSCVKDQCIRTYTMYMPVYRTVDEVRAQIGTEGPREVEHPGKIYVRGPYIFLNELDKGIHIIDNSNPRSPKRVAFLDIPGCVDMAVKGNTLYADAFTDLVVMDISDPTHSQLKKILNGVFPYRYYTMGIMSDESKVVVDWVSSDTTLEVDCGSGGFFGAQLGMAMEQVFMDGPACINCLSSSSSGGGGTPFGMGGSMARFAIMNNHLYTVSTSHLQVIGISTPDAPIMGKDIPLSWNIETIYPFRDRLFIGSSSGMYAFSVANPDDPQQIGRFEHARACDPVVADDNYAYVTLRSGTECQGFINQLDIVDISRSNDYRLFKTYPMDNPHGLSKDGDLLFICEGQSGLKVFDAQNPDDLHLLSVVKDIETYDVIAWRGIALVTTRQGLFQYEYNSQGQLKLLSTIY
jgi:hypothetical protein